jgi:hypothetical protein
MLSFAKIALIVVVVMVVVAFVRGQRAQRNRAAARRKPAPPNVPTETLERCPACGVFRAPGDSFACAREDCPTRRKP